MRSVARDHAEHMVGGGKIDRRGTESVPAQTCLGELDDMLVAMRDGAIDAFVNAPFARVNVGDRSSRPAVTGVERTSRLPGIAYGDEHVIKFTEACLSRHTLSPSPVYLVAADHVLAMIPRR